MSITHLRKLRAICISACIAVAASCEVEHVNQPSEAPANGNINTEPSGPTQPTSSPGSAANDPTAVTLPLLDALLSDEEFAARARSEQQLTTEELEKLRNVARDAVLKLSDDSADDHTRSTREASDAALNQLKKVLGDERAARFISFVSTSLEGQKLELRAPNQVPSDTRIVVNIPAYRMDVFDDGSLVKSYKVGIGYPEFPLPTGLRTAKAIIFNPTWTPPDEPWVKGKVEPGKKVEAGSKLNPLGPIKIPIGSPSLIHGGKSPARLGSFASHGCVGLTNAGIQDFAMTIGALSGLELSSKQIKIYEANKTETKQVPLSDPLAVELRYETIVVENGVLKLYRDVYERGTNTEDNLRRVLEHYGVSLERLQPDVRQKILDALTQMSTNSAGNAVTVTTDNRSESRSARVTMNVKGKKEVAFPLPELAGKGYPAPKNLRAS